MRTFKFYKILTYISITFLILNACNNPSYFNYEEEIYSKLDEILKERKIQLVNHLTEIENLAKKVRNDKILISFFKTKKEYYYLRNDTLMPEYVTIEIEKLKQNIQQYYLMNYLNFYDILFIDTNGEIFYTIKKQEDYHKNIFKDKLSNTCLSKKLKENPMGSFVDFQFYEVSGEPSAFFIEAVFENGNTIGWFVMQYSINKINNLFSENENIGLTGEVVLVNKDHYLLTNSRFKAEPTILKQQLPNNNIESKFREKKGRKSVVDYRGKEVITVFEVFNFLEKEWLIIAKIDKSEVLTQYYLNYEEKLYPRLLKHLKDDIANNKLFENNKKVINVDMDEFVRSDTASSLFTRGVSTCTALLITYPGKFSYLAHISPNDLIYGEKQTDLVNNLFKKIFMFEITQSEKQNLRFYIMSPQKKSFQKLIEIILQNGCFLSQIKIMYNPDAEYGNLFNLNSEHLNYVNWKDKNNEQTFTGQDYADTKTLEQILISDELK